MALFDTPADHAAPLARFSFRSMSPSRKLLSAFIFSAGTSLLVHPIPASAACVFAALLILCSGLPFSFLAKRLLSINIFFALLWLLLPLSFLPRGGQLPLFTFGPFAFYPSGIDLALLVTLKGNAIAAALLALAGSSSVIENGHALRSFHIPDKLVALLLITHSNLILMAREYRRLFNAAKLRGFVPRTSLASYQTYARLVALLLVRSWQHAQRIECAMRLRGFNGLFPLIPSRCTCPPEIQHRNRLAASALLCVCSTVILMLISWDFMLQ